MTTVTPKNISLWPQWLAACDVFLIQLLVGISFGWTSPLIGKLSRENPPFEATLEEISWIASLISLCRPAGVIIGTLTTRYYGSKLSLIFSSICFVLDWTVLALSNSIELVYLSYVLGGIGMGISSTSNPVFISEIADPKIRGGLMTLTYQGLILGLLFGNLMSTHLDPWMMACINLVPSLTFLFTFIWFPSTPFYYIYKNDLVNGKKSLQFYNPKRDVSSEFDSLVQFLNESPKTTLFQTIAKFKETVNRNTLLIINITYSIVQLNGFYTLLEYMEVLFVAARIDLIKPADLVTIASLISVFTSWVAVFITDRIGRVTLLFSAFLIMSLTLYGWGSVYHLHDVGYTDPRFQWIVIVSALIYRSSIVIGFTSVVPTVMGEIFAPDVKGFGICFSNITSALCSFISNKSFQYLVDLLTHKYVFYLYATLTILIAMYCKFFILETKGKSLMEIQDLLRKRYGVQKVETNENPTDNKVTMEQNR